MRKWTLLSLALAIPSLALAESIREYKWEDHKPILSSVSAEKLEQQEGAVSIMGTVEVPIYAGNPGDPGSYVEITLEDGSTHLFLVDFGDAGVGVSQDFVEAAGGEFKKKKLSKVTGATLSVARVDFSIGGASFEDVEVYEHPALPGGSIPISGVFTPATFPELAAALLPSQGVFKLAPASGGAGLKADVKDGVDLPVRWIEAEYYKEGVKGRASAVPMAVDGTVNGKPAVITLTNMAFSGAIARDTVEPPATAPTAGLTRVYSVEVEIPGLDPISGPVVEIPSREFSHAQFDYAIGGRIINHWDMAWDPASHTLRVADASSFEKASWFPTVIAETEKELEPPEPEEGEEPSEPDPKDQAGTYSSLSSVLRDSGDFDGAVTNAKAAIDKDPESCSVHHNLGSLYLGQGMFEEAKPHLQKAAELYDPWKALRLEERKELQEQASEEGDAFEGLRSQPHSCDKAWGDLAEAELATGDPDTAIAIYTDHFDLDRDLALVAGNAWLSQGNVAAAESAYRQYTRSAGPGSYYGSLGLALVLEQYGKTEAAAENYWAAGGMVGLENWARLNNELAGHEATQARLQDLSADLGEFHMALLAQAQEVEDSGGDATTMWSKAAAELEWDLAVYKDNSVLLSAYSYALAKSGNAAGAREAAAKALEANPRAWMAEEVLGMLAEAEGDEGAAAQHRKRAAELGVLDPTLASRL